MILRLTCATVINTTVYISRKKTEPNANGFGLGENKKKNRNSGISLGPLC